MTTQEDEIERLSRDNAALLTENTRLLKQMELKDADIERLTPEFIELKIDEDSKTRSIFTFEQIQRLYVEPVREELQAALNAAVEVAAEKDILIAEQSELIAEQRAGLEAAENYRKSIEGDRPTDS